MPLAVICSLAFAASPEEDFHALQTNFSQNIQQQLPSPNPVKIQQAFQTFIVGCAQLAEKVGKTEEFKAITEKFQNRIANSTKQELLEEIHRYEPEFNLEINVDELASCLLFLELEALFKN